VDETKLATVETFTFRHEAEIVRARLEAGGVIAMVQADDEGGMNPGFFADYGVRVVVHDDDIVEARDILELGADQAQDAPDRDALIDSALAVSLHPEHIAAFRAHADFVAPEECCGLLAFDRPGRVRFVYCLTNIDASRHRFTVDPTEHFRANQHAERYSWEIAGTFHSHPGGSPEPSQTDIESAGDSAWVHVVMSHDPAEKWRIRAFVIDRGAASELAVRVTDVGSLTGHEGRNDSGGSAP